MSVSGGMVRSGAHVGSGMDGDSVTVEREVCSGTEMEPADVDPVPPLVLMLLQCGSGSSSQHWTELDMFSPSQGVSGASQLRI